MGFIMPAQLMALALKYDGNSYGAYLKGLLS
jgi:hypothetical protein